MTAMLVFLLLGLAIISLIRQKDLFSPSKFYILFLAVYFFEIFINDQSIYVYMTYISYILFGLFFVFIDCYGKNPVNRSLLKSSGLNQKRALLALWALTLIPILSQLYLISYFGGLLGYLASIKLRVLEWRGLGVFLVLISILPLVNIIFLMLGLTFKVDKKSWWILYFIHTLLMVSIAMLSGSRGAVLFGFVYILIAGHYFYRRVSIKLVVTAVCILLLSASALEGIRNYVPSETEYSLTDSLDMINLSEVKIFRYGIIPLDMLFEREDYKDYKYGTTFLSAVTIFVPRSIWPDKLETGGEVLTQFSHGSEYTGTVNFSPGLFVESILNFGYVLGVIFYSIVMVGMMFFSIYMHRKFLLLRERGSIKSIKYFYYYITVAMIPGSFLTAEFTKIVSSSIISVTSFLLIYLVIKTQIRVKGPLWQ